MPRLEFHNPPQPDACEVCRHQLRNPDFDARREHTMTAIAQQITVDDLEAAGSPLSFGSIHIGAIGFPGPEQRIEPRHWVMALLETPDVRLMLRPEAL